MASPAKRSGRDYEALAKAVVAPVVVAALAIGGFARFGEALAGFTTLIFSVVLIGAVLFLVWTSDLAGTSKAAVGFLAAAGLSFFLFRALQPPIAWESVELRVTHIQDSDDSPWTVSGTISKGGTVTKAVVNAPAEVVVPAVGGALRVYVDPEHPGRYSAIPHFTDGHFVHLEVLGISGLALVCAVGCVVFSVRNYDRRAPRAFGRHLPVGRTAE